MFARCGRGCRQLACLYLGLRGASMGPVSNDLAMMVRARKVLYDVALG